MNGDGGTRTIGNGDALLALVCVCCAGAVVVGCSITPSLAGTAPRPLTLTISAFSVVAGFIGSSNRLEGRISGRHAEVEGCAVDWAGISSHATTPPESAIDAFVRPHDIDLRLQPPARGAAIPARVLRTTCLGCRVKVQLELPTGRTLSVQLDKDILYTLGIKPGERVYLTLRGAKVFARTSVVPAPIAARV